MNIHILGLASKMDGAMSILLEREKWTIEAGTKGVTQCYEIQGHLGI